MIGLVIRDITRLAGGNKLFFGKLLLSFPSLYFICYGDCFVFLLRVMMAAPCLGLAVCYLLIISNGAPAHCKTKLSLHICSLSVI